MHNHITPVNLQQPQLAQHDAPSHHIFRLGTWLKLTAVLFLLGLMSVATHATAQESLMNDLGEASDNPEATRDAVVGIVGTDMQGKDGELARLGFRLAEIAQEVANDPPRSLNTLQQENFVPEYILIDAVAVDNPQQLLADLQAIGLLDGFVYGRVVSGRLPKVAIIRLVDIPSLLSANPTIVEAQAGAVRSQGDRALNARQARADFSVTGAGVSVVTFSDSFNRTATRYRTDAAADIASGELPPSLTVALESSLAPSATIDEGRAMMQIITDIAPGARQIFHSAFMGQARFAASIESLAAQGVDIMVDDVVYPLQPMFQDGIVSQAIDKAVADGVTYFSAAGNQGRESYQAPFTASGFAGVSGGQYHAFAEGAVFQEVEIPVGRQARFVLQWDEPFASVGLASPGAQNDLDFYLYDGNANALEASIDDNILRGDPVEWFDYQNRGDVDSDGDGQPDTRFYIAIEHVAGPPPSLVKYVLSGDDVRITTNVTNSGTIYGQAAAEGAIAVGAVAYFNTPAFSRSPERSFFSGTGGTPILFDTNGVRLAEPIVRNKPDIMAPTGVNTTFFGTDSDGDGLPNFSGTSAAAPHAAAVAALMLEKRPLLTPDAIRDIMQYTAVDMDDLTTPGFDQGFDRATGYGLIQAERVLGDVFAIVGGSAAPSSDALIISQGSSQAALQLDLRVPEMLPDVFISGLLFRLSSPAGTFLNFEQPLLRNGGITIILDSNQNGVADPGERPLAASLFSEEMPIRFAPLQVPAGSSVSLLAVYRRTAQSYWHEMLPLFLATLLPFRRLGRMRYVVVGAALTVTLLSGCVVQRPLPSSSSAQLTLVDVAASTSVGTDLNISGLPVQSRPLLLTDLVASR
ncbi:MAG: S8 family serine peptidase [Deinococcota bacterium]